MALRIFFAIGWVVLVTGCSIATTRPVQEMYNADAAIKAAKDLHADSLVPELFRAASEYHFKAKREYRLKNFESAKKYALRAMKLAEKAEFDAYRLGGATPEVASSITSPEGANPDQEAATRPILKKEAEEPPPTPIESPIEEKEQAAEPQGTDYNEMVRQQEQEKNSEKKEDTAPKITTPADVPKPGGPTGPDVFFSPVLAQASLPTANTGGLPPNIGSMPPVLPGGSGVGSTDESKPVIDTDRWRIQEESKTVPYSEIPSISDAPIPIMETKEMSGLGHNAQPEKEGLDSLPEQPTSELNKEMPVWDPNREDKK